MVSKTFREDTSSTASARNIPNNHFGSSKARIDDDVETTCHEPIPLRQLQTSQEGTPDVISYNKGQCNERLGSSRVGSSDRQVEACARGRLRKEGGGKPANSTRTGVEGSSGRQQRRSEGSSNQTTFLRFTCHKR